VSRIFLSHSSANNAEAIALRDWLVAEGWSDLFLDLDPNRGIAAGERWERALNEAARRCEAVLFLISRQWLASRWCMNELTLARRLNKRLFGVLVEEGLAIADLPADVTSHWQLVNLATGRDHQQFRVTLPVTGEEQHVTYSHEGLSRLKAGLQRAGLHASYFAWPPETDRKRAPYRGLRPLEADDAGIFFGREAPVIEAIDRLRGLTEAAPPRLMVILGASGAGKSSFLRAGLLPRLGRDPQTFLPLPVLRPERAAISGETGLVAALAGAFEATPLKVARGDIREAVAGGAATLKQLLARLQEAAQPPAIEGTVAPKPPTLVVAIDQGEELFLAEAQGEAQPFLTLLRDLVISDKPAVIAVFTIRSDNYERLQSAAELEGVHKMPLDLGPMPKGSYAEVVKGPIRRLDGTARAIKLDDNLSDALLADIEAGGAKDALPLLAFTLERLYEEYGATGHLTLDHFNKLGRVKGSIEAAVERAFAAADKDSRIPRDREARLTLLRRGLIPWLAGIDPDTKAPRRRVARLSEIPAEARPLIDLLVEQRLLATDVAKDTGETTIEPAHEALLRQWGLLQGWLSDDTGLLTVLDGIKRAARDWAANAKAASWLAHSTDRLRAAERLMARPDLAANLEPTDKAYLTACQREERTASWRRVRAAAAVLILLLGIGGATATQARWLPILDAAAHKLINMRTDLAKAGEAFRDCSSCPEMVVVRAGSFMMGSPESDKDAQASERPQREVTIGQAFAVSKFEITFDQWDACFLAGGCTEKGGDEGWGRGNRPAINVNWNDAQQYVTWVSGVTGQKYRLLTEAEWEYAARGGKTTRYSWGNDVGEGNANCDGCKSQWDNKQTAPVGSFKHNDFGLFDMHGNVWEWVQDCYDEKAYASAPRDGTAIKEPAKCESRVLRGGSWVNSPGNLRAASRGRLGPVGRVNVFGFRVARVLPPART
jgi:formylglycine-generating enzyme required for sulfatase activity